MKERMIRKVTGEHDPWKIYLADVNRRPLIKHPEIVALFRKYHAGDQAARDTIAEANLRLVIHVALKWQATGVELGDLVQMGSIGLLRAIDKFDPDRGFRFSTYATWWIRQAIQRNVANTQTTIRIPIHAQREAKSRGVTHPHASQSLDDPVNDDGDLYLRDFVEDADSVPADDDVEIRDLQAVVHAILDAMEDMDVVDDREPLVLRLRFGLLDDYPQTLDEVGEVLKVTRERVRQIELSAKRNFRRHLRFAQPRLYEAVKASLNLGEDD